MGGAVTVTRSVELFDIFDTSDGATWSEGLSERQVKLLESALAFHALDNPGATLEVSVYLGGDHQFPVLTDIRTFTNEYIAPLAPARTFRMRSTVPGPTRVHIDPRDGRLLSTGQASQRHILLTPDTATTESVRKAERHNIKWRARYAIEQRLPLAYDRARQVALARRERNLQAHPITRRDSSADAVKWNVAAPTREGAPKAVIIGIHWFELGGAEQWAFDSVQRAKDAGLLPIVISDRESQHNWITRPEMAGAVCIPLTHPCDQPAATEPLLRHILETFDVRGVFVHHCQWLYDRLPWIRNSRPEIPVMDALHIVEYAGGGYPASGVHHDKYIDIHHVISPQLESWLIQNQKVKREKIVMAPLIGLTNNDASAAEFKRRDASAPLRIAFVGRLTHQKRPYLFVHLVDRLRKSGVKFEAIMHGSGMMDSAVRDLTKRLGVSQYIEFRNEKTPVRQTLDDSDLLVLSSQNEGITLTTFEALAAGVPVLSTNVGSQRTIVPSEFLVPREPSDFLSQSVRQIGAFARSEQLRERAWKEEVERAHSFSQSQRAHHWVEGVFSSWSQ